MEITGRIARAAHGRSGCMCKCVRCELSLYRLQPNYRLFVCLTV